MTYAWKRWDISRRSKCVFWHYVSCWLLRSVKELYFIAVMRCKAEKYGFVVRCTPSIDFSFAAFCCHVVRLISALSGCWIFLTFYKCTDVWRNGFQRVLVVSFSVYYVMPYSLYYSFNFVYHRVWTNLIIIVNSKDGGNVSLWIRLQWMLEFSKYIAVFQFSD